MTIDDFTPEQWPEDVSDALDAWRQGHLLVGSTGVWLTEGGVHDVVTDEDATEDPSGHTARASNFSDTNYLAVISQTCDIAASGPGARHPFVQVCPVRDVGRAFTKEKVNKIKSGEVVEYFYLTEPSIEGDWAVDLRASTAMSKSLLARVEPVEGFANEDDELSFSEHIAAKFRRPALHDYLSSKLVQGLTRVVERERGKSTWIDDIEQLRIDIVQGTRLVPVKVRLIVVTEVAFASGAKEALRNEWKSHKKSLANAGIGWSPIAFRELSKLSVADYRASVPINIAALAKGNFY